jgi:hypothetical protein
MLSPTGGGDYLPKVTQRALWLISGYASAPALRAPSQLPHAHLRRPRPSQAKVPTSFSRFTPGSSLATTPPESPKLRLSKRTTPPPATCRLSSTSTSSWRHFSTPASAPAPSSALRLPSAPLFFLKPLETLAGYARPQPCIRDHRTGTRPASPLAYLNSLCFFYD